MKNATNFTWSHFRRLLQCKETFLFCDLYSHLVKTDRLALLCPL